MKRIPQNVIIYNIGFEGGFRNGRRIIYSNKGAVYYTEDHYSTFEELYEGEKNDNNELTVAGVQKRLKAMNIYGNNSASQSIKGGTWMRERKSIMTQKKRSLAVDCLRRIRL